MIKPNVIVLLNKCSKYSNLYVSCSALIKGDFNCCIGDEHRDPEMHNTHFKNTVLNRMSPSNTTFQGSENSVEK